MGQTAEGMQRLEKPSPKAIEGWNESSLYVDEGWNEPSPKAKAGMSPSLKAKATI